MAAKSKRDQSDPGVSQRRRMIKFLRDMIADLEKEQEEAAATPRPVAAKRRRAA